MNAGEVSHGSAEAEVTAVAPSVRRRTSRTREIFVRESRHIPERNRCLGEEISLKAHTETLSMIFGDQGVEEVPQGGKDLVLGGTVCGQRVMAAAGEAGGDLAANRAFILAPRRGSSSQHAHTPVGGIRDAGSEELTGGKQGLLPVLQSARCGPLYEPSRGNYSPQALEAIGVRSEPWCYPGASVADTCPNVPVTLLYRCDRCTQKLTTTAKKESEKPP